MSFFPEVPSVTVAGMKMPLKNLITLYAVVGGSLARCVARQGDQSSGYTPSGTNKFRVKAVRVLTTVSGSYMYLLQSSTDIGFNVSTAWVTATYIANDIEASKIMYSAAVSGAQQYTDLTVDFLIANGAFVGIENQASTGEFRVQIFGYEEP